MPCGIALGGCVSCSILALFVCVCLCMSVELICAFVCVVFLLQQWHPDRWTRTPSLLGEAKRKFQQIQEAYSGNFLFFHRFISMQSISN